MTFLLAHNGRAYAVKLDLVTKKKKLSRISLVYIIDIWTTKQYLPESSFFFFTIPSK